MPPPQPTNYHSNQAAPPQSCRSLAADQLIEADLLEAIRALWDAIENGTHYFREASFGGDACRVVGRGAAKVLASLSNLARALHELAQERGTPVAPSAKCDARQMIFGQTLAWLRR